MFTTTCKRCHTEVTTSPRIGEGEQRVMDAHLIAKHSFYPTDGMLGSTLRQYDVAQASEGEPAS